MDEDHTGEPVFRVLFHYNSKTLKRQYLYSWMSFEKNCGVGIFPANISGFLLSLVNPGKPDMKLIELNYDVLFQEMIDLIGHFKAAVSGSPDLMQEVVQFETRLFDVTDKFSGSFAAVAEFEVWTEDQRDALLTVKNNLVAVFSLRNEMDEFEKRLQG